MTRVVLGSASTGRLSVLRGAGIDPLIIVSDVDEDALLAAHADAPAAERVRVLAEAKADAVTVALPAEVAADCVVIGCDSMLLLDGALCGKPGDAAAARAQWQSMAGRAGQLLTGHCVVRVRSGRTVGKVGETGSTTVHFDTPTEADLTAYIARGEPLGVAGGFTLDGLGGWFVRAIEGDPSNVIGLSLPLTRRLFERVGVSIDGLWGAGGNSTDLQHRGTAR
ncbi:Maf-like protein CE0735 [Mycolicibacterium chitae]|uniref:Nucleoside triphosphate pyrophosphatase n=2 Tax=Mycolicibacterium chitae TaxID=1792 RepID=A0A448I9V6_MYCCI|nr:Maf-like protein CE0735 [Mycolicibacterium chitae]